MASNPPGLCCLNGFKHEGTPEGKTKQIGDIPTYIASPTDTSHAGKAIIYLSDVFGISNNGMLLADEFARQGYLTVYPDLLQGDHLAPDDFFSGRVDMVEWASRHGPDAVDPVIEATIDYVRNTLGIKKAAAVGYCFGGKYVARFLRENKLDSGFTAHPSFMSVEELSGVEKPFAIAAAEHDTIFPQQNRIESENILSKSKQRFQINLYSGVSHGFGVRGDLSVPAELFAKEAALTQAVAWFNSTL
ncbi:dienelactone hydrolase family protein [Coniochaeta sp. 2T2.1]|nr:dienelactone hydrolase family protein [Coniochaeta sp. 2T2.1]